MFSAIAAETSVTGSTGSGVPGHHPLINPFPTLGAGGRGGRGHGFLLKRSSSHNSPIGLFSFASPSSSSQQNLTAARSSSTLAPDVRISSSGQQLEQDQSFPSASGVITDSGGKTSSAIHYSHHDKKRTEKTRRHLSKSKEKALTKSSAKESFFKHYPRLPTSASANAGLSSILRLSSSTQSSSDSPKKLIEKKERKKKKSTESTSARMKSLYSRISYNSSSSSSSSPPGTGSFSSSSSSSSSSSKTLVRLVY